MPSDINHSPRLHLLFEIGVWTRGALAIFHLVAALGIYFTSTTSITNVLLSFASRELSEDPHDLLAHLLLRGAEHISQPGKDYAALFFFVSALINITLVVGLHTNKRGIYPIASYLISAFIIYQIWLFTNTPSLWLILFAVYDGIMIWLIYLEYRQLPSKEMRESGV